MTQIFLSYRRSDTEQIAGRIFDRLSKQFDVCFDVDTIPAGADFRRHIEAAAEQSDAFLALIGMNWLEKDLMGHPRILHPNDWVRIEIETAIKCKKPLIPVLIGRATMPSAHELPGSLKDFPYLSAAQVDVAKDFHIHMSRLIALIERRTRSSGQVRTVTSQRKTGRPNQKSRDMPAEPIHWFPIPTDKGDVRQSVAGAGSRPLVQPAKTTGVHGLDYAAFRRYLEFRKVDLLQNILPGTWEVTPAGESGWALRLEMRSDGSFRGELPSPGWPQPHFAVQGNWDLLENRLTLRGDQISSFRATPFRRSFTLQQLTDNELAGTMHSTAVTWRRLRIPL
jgi:hypothetical protein